MRKNPTITTERGMLSMPDGIELPNASGVSSEALAEGNQMPDVNMSPNDGDNPSMPDVSAFASGKDMRPYGPCPKSNPTPGMPGA